MGAMNIGVLVVVAHSALRAGFATILSKDADITIVGQASNGLEALEKADSLKPQVILMERRVAGCDGLEATARIKESHPESKVLMLLDAERVDEVRQALARGAVGYVLVSYSEPEVLHAVKRAAAGELVLSPNMASALTAQLRDKITEPKLSAREDEVLNLLGEGLTNKEIAQRLVVSESTVRTYVYRLTEKLNLGTRNEAVAFGARRQSIIDIPGEFHREASAGYPTGTEPRGVLPVAESMGPTAGMRRIMTTGERRSAAVTWMEFDGSATPPRAVEPEVIEEATRECLDLAGTEVRRIGGIILWASGNSLVSVFGLPSQEQAPYQALKAGLNTLKRLRDHNTETGKTGIYVGSRVGVSFGPVLVGKPEDTIPVECVPIGDTAEIAARIAYSAGLDTIVVTESICRLTRQWFRFEPLGELPAATAFRPIRMFLLQGDAGERGQTATPPPHSLTNFVGRDREMGVLLEAFEKAQSGSGQVIGVVGDAGVGKTRLVREFRERLAGSPVVWLEGSCLYYGSHIPYLPLLDMLRSYFNVDQGEHESSAGPKIWEALRQLNHRLIHTLPPLKDILSLEVDDSEYAGLAPSQKRGKIFEALRSLLLRQAQDMPVVLVFEDMHWADATSEDFLTRLMSSLANSRILLLLLYRPEYSHKWSGKSVYSQIRLDELSTESILLMIRSILADGEIDPALERLALERAGGNPLFLEEFLSTPREEGSIIKKNHRYALSISAADVNIPYSVQGMIQCRIDRLDNGARQTLRAASVIGPEFTYGILRAVSGKERDIKTHLLALEDAGLIYEKRIVPEPEYSFKHNLTREIAYRSLIASKKREAHQKTAEAIEAAYEDRLEAFYAVLAHHYFKSENMVKAHHYLSLSAAKAAHSYSNWEAFRLGKQAIRALERLPVSEDALKKGIRIRLKMEGSMRLLAYPEDSSQILEEGIQMCSEIGDTRSLAVLYSSMGLCCAFRGDPLRGIEYSRKCVDEAAKVEDVALLATVGFDLCSAYAITGHFVKTVEVAPRIIRLLEKHHRESEFLGGPFNFNLYSALSAYYGHALAWTGNFRKGEAVCRKALAFAAEIGSLYSIAFAELMYGLLLDLKGEGHQAVQALQEAVRHGEQGEVIPIIVLAHNGLGNAYCCLGEMESAMAEMAQSQRIREESAFTGLLSEFRYDLGKVQLENGDLYGARISAEEALRLSVANHQRWVEGAANMLLGRVLVKADISRIADAEKRIRQGMDVFADLGLRTFWAQASLFLGELYVDTGHKDEAITHIQAGAEAFKKMGSRYWFGRAQELLQKAKTA